jgi:uncharacterized protein YhdP
VKRSDVYAPKTKIVTLHGLPGVDEKETPAVVVRSVTEATKWLRAEKAIAAFGSEGSINVHRDSSGMWRCEFQRFRRTLDAKEWKHLATAAQWLKETWPRLENVLENDHASN